MLIDKLKAIEFAIIAHEGQLRKGTEIPYATHVISVGQILQEFGYGDSVVIAGILHDTIEDTPTTIDEIKAEFGLAVAKIVQGCTEDKRLSWEERKSHLIETMGILDEDTQAVVIADKLHNLMSIEREMDQIGEKVFDRFYRGKVEQQWYYEGLAKGIGSSSLIYSSKLYTIYREYLGRVFSPGNEI